MMVIAVDTGNRFIKTAHATPFTAGLNYLYSDPPIVPTSTLFFNGNYFTFSETQGDNRKDKTVDDYYYYLTLAGIAREIVMKRAMEKSQNGDAVNFELALKRAEKNKVVYEEDIVLSVGLPPRDMNQMRKKFKEYFFKYGSRLEFKYNGIEFGVNLKEVFVSPQGFAAIFPNDLFNQVCQYPQSYIIDIGGYTTDVAMVANRSVDTSFYKSLDYGVIHLYNKIIDAIGKKFTMNISIVMIEAVLRGGHLHNKEVEDEVIAIAERYAQEIISALKDKGIDLDLSLPVLLGGGVQLLKKPLVEALSREDALIIPDVRANAIGYEIMANRILKGRGQRAQ